MFAHQEPSSFSSVSLVPHYYMLLSMTSYLLKRKFSPSLSLYLKKINVSHKYPISSFMFTPHPHRQILFSSRIHFLCPFIFLPLYCITGSAQEAWTKQYSISKIPRMNKTIPPHSPLPWRFLMKCCKSRY